MPEIPVKTTLSPCQRHGCAECCYETEMPLLNADIKRLEALGHKREDFVLENQEFGFHFLKNTEPTDGSRPHCVFLKENLCSVYADRPEGCRHYPIVYEPGKRGPVRDRDCPHNVEFNISPSQFKTLPLVIKNLTREARLRREAVTEEA